jgi:hypothetical protein
MNYTITYDDGKIRQVGECPAPDRLPQVGDVYKFEYPIWTLAQVTYDVGDTLEIVARTTAAPHHRTSSLGNLTVRCKYMTSVWTNIELMIANGWLKLVE